MKLGDVLQRTDEIDGSLIRIIGLDEFEVFYDSWWEHSSSWGMENTRSAIFYRMAKSVCLDSYEVIHNEGLSDKEKVKISPDLAHRTALLADWAWTETEYASIELFKSALGSQVETLIKQVPISTNKIGIIPMGPKGGVKPKVIVTPKNAISFHPLELLWKAHNIQAKYKTNIENGVGIYRAGISNSIPTYYLGGNGDNAGIYTA